MKKILLIILLVGAKFQLFAIFVAVPTVTTDATPSVFTTTSATLGGNVTDTVGSAITGNGIVYSLNATNPSPSIGGTGVTQLATASPGTSTGPFSDATGSVLLVNSNYAYKAYATNSAGTNYGSNRTFFTRANTPGTSTVSNATSASLEVLLSSNSNPGITEFVIFETTASKYVQADGTLGASMIWQTANNWGAATVTGLNSSTTYTFKVKARNGDNVETPYGGTASGTTLPALVTTLPGDGSFSSAIAPQDSLKNQRQFYLISPSEMLKSGFVNGMEINSIGFTNAVAPAITTKGHFKVWLQNTSDIASRADTGWTTVSTTSSSYVLNNLVKGDYDVEIKGGCSGSSINKDTIRFIFSTNNLSGCNTPTNLTTDNIDTSTATFNWVAPTSASVIYEVQYDFQNRLDWPPLDSVYTVNSGTSYSATGLQTGKNYKWRVRSKCSSTDSSNFVIGAFSTGESVLASCGAPTSTGISTSTSTSDTISWNKVTGATSYGIQYRRKGTSLWQISFAGASSAARASAILIGLNSGTTYEWKVRTNCAAGKSAYVSGPLFTTQGNTVCYAPAGVSADSVSASAAKLSWVSSTAASYDIRYRLKNFIVWTSNAIANPTPADTVKLVMDDTLTIPNTVGPYDAALTGPATVPFTYNGGGLYVAYEYQHFSGSPSSIENTALCTSGEKIIKNYLGGDSLRLPISFGANNQIALPETLTANLLRPETRFGSPAMKDSVEVSNVYTLGNNATHDGDSTFVHVSALIKNHSSSDHSYSVRLLIKNQVTNSTRRDITRTSDVVNAYSSDTVNFDTWLSTLSERDSIIVSVPAASGETYALNNTSFYLQNVNNYIMSYDDGTNAITSAGHGNNSGLTLCKYNMKGCGRVNSAQVYLSFTAKNHSIYGVLLDNSGNVLDTSQHVTYNSSEINTYHSFYFPNSPLLNNEDYFIGLAQTADPSNTVNPVGVQWEGTDIRTNSYYHGTLADPSVLSDHPSPGRLMIRAEVIPATPTVGISGRTSLCTVTSIDTLIAESRSTRFANKVLGYSSQNSSIGFTAEQVLGTPNVYPAYSIGPNSWLGSSADDQREYLTLGFPGQDSINFIDIYETFTPGSVDSVYADSSGTFIQVYPRSAADSAYAAAPAARINHITIPLTHYNVSRVKITFNSPKVRGYNAIDAVAIGWINKPSYRPEVTYSWLPASFTTSANNDSVFVTNAGHVTVSATDGNNCPVSASVNINLASTVASTIDTLGRPTVFCAGDSVRLQSSRLYGNIWSNGDTARTITIKTSGTYSVSFSNGPYCGSVTSSPIVVTVNPLPVVTVTGLSFCPGGSTNLDPGPYAGYLWSTLETSRTINVSTVGSYTVTVTNANGCKGSRTVTTSLAPVPFPSITGNSTFCPGDSILLNAGSGYSSYSWTGGKTVQSIYVKALSSYTVTVTNIFGCAGSSTAVTHQFVPPSPVITGASSFCPGDSTTLVANIGFSSYTWSTGALTQSIKVKIASTFTVTVTDLNGCKGSTSQVTSLFIPPSPVISGNLSICNGETTILDAGVGYPVYQWSTGANSHSISTAVIGPFSVIVTDNNGCKGTANATTVLNNSAPGIPGPITGQLGGLCNATSKVYSISQVPFATIYHWTVPSGCSITGRDDTTFVTVTFNSFVVASISVVASNTCGQSPVRTLIVNGAPETINTLVGPPSGVCKQNGVAYSITPLAGPTIYGWSVPSGATIASGQGTTNITVNFGAGFSSGNICATASNNCGSNSKCVLITAVPEMPGTITGPAGVCKKQSNVSYSTAPVYGATSYTWDGPPGSRISLGQGTTSAKITFSNNSGIVSVKATNACGSSVARTFAVSFNCREGAGVANQSGEILQQVTAYPNPTTGKLNVSFNSSVKEKYSLKVMNLLGNTFITIENVAAEGNNIDELDLTAVAKGMYFISLERENSDKTLIRVIVE